MARTSKIARLPFETREQLNRRLRNGEKGPKLLQWLNGLPETQAVMAKEFAAQPINPTNLSQWRTGGFEAWLNEQEALGTVHEVMDQAGQLAQVTHDALSDRLAVLVTARYALAARKLGQEQADWQPLRELCHDLAVLRRGDHGAGWLHSKRSAWPMSARNATRTSTSSSSNGRATPKSARPSAGATSLAKTAWPCSNSKCSATSTNCSRRPTPATPNRLPLRLRPPERRLQPAARAPASHSRPALRSAA